MARASLGYLGALRRIKIGTVWASCGRLHNQKGMHHLFQQKVLRQSTAHQFALWFTIEEFHISQQTPDRLAGDEIPATAAVSPQNEAVIFAFAVAATQNFQPFKALGSSVPESRGRMEISYSRDRCEMLCFHQSFRIISYSLAPRPTLCCALHEVISCRA